MFPQNGQPVTKVSMRGYSLKVLSLTLLLQPQTSSLTAAGLRCNLKASGCFRIFIPVRRLSSVALQRLTISPPGIH